MAEEMVNNNFLEFLGKKNIISSDKLEEIKKMALSTEKAIDDFLIGQKILNIEKITELKAEMTGLIYKDITTMKADEKALGVFSFEVAKNYKIVCFQKDGDKISVGLTDPYDSKAIEAVNFSAKEQDLKVEYFLVSEDGLNNIYNQYQNLQKEISTALESKAEEEAGEEEEPIGENEGEEELVEENVSSAPVAKIVSVIIRHAVEEKASDIHIEPMQKNTRIRYRIDGLLRTSLILPKSIHSAVVGRIKVLAKLKLDETRIPQDGRIRLLVNKKEIDFRISVMPLMGEEKVVMRILDLGKGIPTLPDLGYDHRALQVIKENIKKTFGLLLITGPTGSGKSTTLAAVLEMLNKDEVNIITLEDPVEYYVKGVNQSQIKPAIGYSFATGLRSILRQDPDVIMVGEIRDNETAELCIHAGLTGHFVLSTLHTNNAIDVIPRLLDMKVEPFLLGSTLNTLVAQRLARRICPNCKKKVSIAADEVQKIKDMLKDVPEHVLKERVPGLNSLSDITDSIFSVGAGCSHCKNTGYSGRVAVVEVIDVNKDLQNIIMDSSRILREEDVRKTQEFITMEQDGLIKAIQGITTLQEVFRVIQD